MAAPATTFPLSELSKEIQTIIWKFVIDDFASQELSIKFYFRQEAYYHESIRTLLSKTSETHIRLVSRTRGGDTIYSTSAWFRTRWVDIMNTCVLARWMALERLWAAVMWEDVVVVGDRQRRDVAMVLSSISEGLEERLMIQ